MQKKADRYDKVTWWLMAFSGVIMWGLVAYAMYETFSQGTPFN
jgi:succinate dehydrogenase hydrophobic anchor subunit